jgi:purine-binding chemotaxis protein CheW
VSELQFCTFLLDGLTFGVPVSRVQEVMRYQPMTRVPLSGSSIAGLINLRGQIVTAVDLRRRIGLADRPEPDEGGRPPANVVIRSDDGGVSLLVDEIGGVIEVGDEDFEEPPHTTPPNVRRLLTGVYKLDGQLLLLLDVDQVLSADPTPVPAG